MKYLEFHKILWIFLIILFTLFELILITFGCIVKFLWDFHFPKNIWERLHYEDNKYRGAVFRDKNILETLNRRYHILFNK